MKLLVCLKIVNDLDGVLDEDWEVNSRNSLNINYTKQIIDYYDEAALELALRLRESYRENSNEFIIDVVTVDPNDRDLLFKTLYAVGVDNITQIKPNEELVFSPYKIAMMISNFAKLDYNVILFGMQNSLYNNCQTHYAVANALNIGCVSNVTNLEIINDDLKVYFDEDQYSIRGIVTPPVVIAVSNTQLPYLRMPTLREKLNAGKRSVNYIESSKLLSSQERKLPVDFQLKSVGHEKHTRNCKFLSERAEEFVEQIFKEYLN